MADFEYVDVNGRQIRVRPRETAQEIDEYGNFHRQPNRFTEGFGEGKNPIEKKQIYSFLGKRMQLVQSGSDRKRASRT